MIDLLFQLISFAIKLFLIVSAIGWVIRMITAQGDEEAQHGLKVVHLNETYKRQTQWLEYALLPPEARQIIQKAKNKEEKSLHKAKKKRAKKEVKEEVKASKKSKKRERSASASASPLQTDHPPPQTVTDEGNDRPPEDLDQAEALEGSDRSTDTLDAPESTSAESSKDIDTSSERRRLFILDFKGDIQASSVENLRHEVSALLSISKPDDEVLVRLHNAGGYVHTHGLAASQLTRLKEGALKLTIAVDQVAASGGYMMACVSDRIIAAPFAIIGSIGVVAQVPNVNRLLKRLDVDVELHTAGEYKRTLTFLGENTPEGREKFIEDLQETHTLFQEFVQTQRPQLQVDLVATGETWYGARALAVGLIDEVKTSDEYILESIKSAEVYSVEYKIKRRLGERFLSVAHAIINGRIPGV